MLYAFYQTDWGILNRPISSGLGKETLLLYSDVIPIQIQQQFSKLSNGLNCPPIQLRLRKLIIDAVDVLIEIVYPFRGNSVEHENTIAEMKSNPKIVGWTVIGERWIEC